MEHHVEPGTLTPNRIVKVPGDDKKRLFAVLADAAADELGEITSDVAARRLWEREQLLSTRLGDHIAMPHAQFPDIDRTVVIVALCPDGISYDAHTSHPVHLVFCIVGDQAAHLDVLARVAATLQVTGATDALLDAARDGDENRVAHILHRGDESSDAPADPTRARRTARSQRIWRHALELAPQVGARFILLHASSNDAKAYQVPSEFDGEVFVLTPEELGVPGHDLTRVGGNTGAGLTVALLYALTERRVQAGDVIINVYGSHDPNLLDTLQVTDVEAAFRLFFAVSRELSLESKVQRVMLRVVELAAEIASEGREGKPVGALFVVGDLENVMPHCQQMLMNPFKGHDAEHRNILDPGLTETIKELARIDGAFIISPEGVIESAGTYLRVDIEVTGLPSGLGARHTAAAAITGVSEAVAVVISESTRQVSIFRHGRRVVIL